MDPFTISLGILAVSGLAQAFIAAQARGAAREDLQKIKDDYDRLTSQLPNYNLKITDPPELHKQTLQQPQFAQALEAPAFNHSLLQLKEHKQLEKYVPQIAHFVKEERPREIERTPALEKGREAQLNALKRFTQIGEGGFDPEYQEKIRKAAEATQREAQGRQGALAQSFARRGLGGSGLELVANIANQGHLMNRLASANAQSAGDSYRNQLLALARGAELGGQIGNQEMNLQGRNADIINNFNARMANALREQKFNEMNAQNAGRRFNIEQAQGLANRNVEAANENLQNQRARQDRILEFLHKAKMNEQARRDALQQWGYNAGQRANRYNNELARYGQEWKRRQIQDENALKNNVFENKLGIMQGQHGAQRDIINNNIGAAQDLNQAISGLGELGASGADHYMTPQAKKKQTLIEDEI